MKQYQDALTKKETELAIRSIKDFFQLCLSTELNLTRVTAPLFVPAGLGINDDLNGTEKPVAFVTPNLGGQSMEIVQSLAKWKRLKLTEMETPAGFGIYTDMNAIRPFEAPDATHSLYVDQWDWEMRINERDRTVFFLFDIVKRIYRCIKRTEFFIFDRWPTIKPTLPEDVKLIYSDDLYNEYPNVDAKERERKAAKKYGAVFIAGIGGKLPDGSIHDGRAPDYDDWISDAGDGHVGLNGDLIVWDELLQNGEGDALELSSMGIRVVAESLKRQLDERGCPERAKLYFHKKLLNGELVPTLGGGIGQSRLCMFLLKKIHIGQIQVSVWDEKERKAYLERGVSLL